MTGNRNKTRKKRQLKKQRSISLHDEAKALFASDGFPEIENYLQLRSKNFSGYGAYYLRNVFEVKPFSS